MSAAPDTLTAAAIGRTLAGLCAIDTTSARPNGAFMAHVEPRLLNLGFRVERRAYLDGHGVAKENLIARFGPADGKAALALVGHSDCVPFDPAWKEALTLTDLGDRFVARGACDTKGFIACALHALEAVHLASLRAPLLFVLTADEEVGCLGAKRLVDERALDVKFAVVGEPTSLRPIRANKGYCLGEVTFTGKEGHSAYPEVGASAIAAAGQLLVLLRGLDAELRTLGDGDFVPPHTTTNVGLISGGKAKNIIPGSCSLTLEWRPIPGQDPAFVEQRVRALLEQAIAAVPGTTARFDVPRLDGGFSTAPESALVRWLQAASGKAPDTVAFGTEGPQLTALGAEAVVFGPGDITVAHRTGEWVPKVDLEGCATHLAGAVRHFCG